jgi:hypothetical protein
MPDPDLLSNNCDGETSTVQLGTAPASLTPNQRLGIVKRDNRTIVNDDAIAAPGNGGDLPGGLKVNICREANVVPTLRFQQDCGLVVMAPQIETIENLARVSLAANASVDDDPAPVEGPTIQIISGGLLTNNDTVSRLVTVSGRCSIITAVIADGAMAEGQWILRSILTGGVFLGGGGAQNARVVTMVYPSGNFGGRTLNHQFEFCDKLIIPPGGSRQILYRTAAIRTSNIVTAASGPPPPGTPFRGVNLAGVTVRSEQVRP